MRDTSRIRKFCNELSNIWETECPDWRFGQLIENIFRIQKNMGEDPFFFEEDRMMLAIKQYFGLEKTDETQT